MINCCSGCDSPPACQPPSPLFSSLAAPFPLPHPAAACPDPVRQVPSAPYPALIHSARPLKIAACLKWRPEAELHKRRRPSSWALVQAISWAVHPEAELRACLCLLLLSRGKAVGRLLLLAWAPGSASVFPGTHFSPGPPYTGFSSVTRDEGGRLAMTRQRARSPCISLPHLHPTVWFRNPLITWFWNPLITCLVGSTENSGRWGWSDGSSD